MAVVKGSAIPPAGIYYKGTNMLLNNYVELIVAYCQQVQDYGEAKVGMHLTAANVHALNMGIEAMSRNFYAQHNWYPPYLYFEIDPVITGDVNLKVNPWVNQK